MVLAGRRENHNSTCLVVVGVGVAFPNKPCGQDKPPLLECDLTSSFTSVTGCGGTVERKAVVTDISNNHNNNNNTYALLRLLLCWRQLYEMSKGGTRNLETRN